MGVDIKLLKDFINITNDTEKPKPKNIYGTIVTDGNTKYVKIDGSEIRTPFRSATDVKQNERVLVNIDNHMAVVTNNLSDPSAGGDRVTNNEGKIEHFDHLFAGNITAENIHAGAISADKILAGSITADKIQAGAISTPKLQAESITADKIQANAISTDKLQANSITAEKIKADAITTGTIKAEAITAEKIKAGAITADKIQAGSITAGSSIIGNGAIGDAQISNLDASKIQAGSIDTSKVTITGSNGNLIVKGNRLQVFEGVGNSQNERVSLGDVNNDGTKYGLRVRGKDGTTILYDENGVYGEGITNGSITNDKINGDANIDGSKINIASVIRKINEDGSETISGIKIDINNESLTTKINTIVNTQTNDKKIISENTSKIDVNSKAIKLKVDEQIYTENLKDMTTELSKHTSDINIVKEGIKLSATKTEVVNQIKTSEDGTKNYVNESIKSNNAKLDVNFNSINMQVSEIITDVTGVKTAVSKIDISIGSITSKVEGLDNKYTEVIQTTNSISSKVNGLDNEVSGLNGKYSEIIQTTNSISSKVNGLESKYTEIIQTTDSITSKVNGLDDSIDGINKKYTEIVQTTTSITSRVNGLDTKYTEIVQTTNGITSRVNGLDGKYTEIKQTVDGININGKVDFEDLENKNSWTTIHGGNIKTDSISLKTLSSNDTDPILKLFPSTDGGYCSIDATRQYETGGRGDAIRLKWDRKNYIAVGDRTIKFFMNGVITATVDTNGLKSNNSRVSVEGHTHNYASSSHGHSGDTWGTLNLGNLYLNYLNYKDNVGSKWAVISNCHFANGNGNYLGVSNARWQGAFLVSSPNVGSDIRLKENVKYTPKDKDNILTRTQNVLSTEQMHNFIKDDLKIAEYDYIYNPGDISEVSDEDRRSPNYVDTTCLNHGQVGFIAQDIVNTEVGSKIVTKDPDGMLGYETGNYMSVIAGALQHEITKRDDDIKMLLNEINILKNRIDKLESNIS